MVLGTRVGTVCYNTTGAQMRKDIKPNADCTYRLRVSKFLPKPQN